MPAFWQLPGPKLAKTGLSEQVDPFDIAKLSNSDELVFRVRFDNKTPVSPYYWRALVHDTFDGNAWKTSDLLKFNNKTTEPIKQLSVTNSYTIIAEPANQKWLYGLNYATSNNKYVDSNALGLLRKKQYQAKSLQYQVSNSPLSTEQLSDWQINYYTRLNNKTNSQAQQLAITLKERSRSDKDFYNTLLNYFATKGFSYTLTPDPMTGNNTIDQFLFEKQRGFCGHYASAAAYMFRNSRYSCSFGKWLFRGRKNQANNYLSVRQYDAHAWVEVYINNQWQIFDATAVVAPERLNGSLSQNEELNDEFKSNLDFGLVSLSNFAAINWLRLKLETLDYQWTSWVLGFDEEKQSNFLKSLFGSKNIWLVPLGVVLFLITSFSAYFIYLNWPRNNKKQAPLVNELESLNKWAKK
ncbi:transglutaminaseTgpA domain-containing protein [Pseudoalteromonas espejiana]